MPEPAIPGQAIVVLARRIFFLTSILVASFVLASSALADTATDIGYNRLQFWQSDALPTGRSVSVIIVEASTSKDPGKPQYAIDVRNPEFDEKTIVDRTGLGSGTSRHATVVARLFVGNSESIAPGIVHVDGYHVLDWYGAAFLAPMNAAGSLRSQPRFTTARVGNHSFVGSFGPANAESLRRLDWLIATDEFIQVVGFSGSENPIASSAFNTIAVDNTAAVRRRGTVRVDRVYTGRRTRPEIVVPELNPSRSAPWVAAASVLLVEAGHRDPDLSTDPAANSTTNRAGRTIYNAERSEVIKAALMAGARRETKNEAGGDIDAYRGRSADRSANGLDRRYGAGQLDIYNSFKIITAGEQNSLEDVPKGKGIIGETGFDYDPAFGGDEKTNSDATYYFSTADKPTRLTAALVWNIDIDGGVSDMFIGTATLHDLNLVLYEVTDNEDWREVASSQSFSENSENLYQILKTDTDYAVRVTSVGRFKHDFAIAWRIQPN